MQNYNNVYSLVQINFVTGRFFVLSVFYFMDIKSTLASHLNRPALTCIRGAAPDSPFYSPQNYKLLSYLNGHINQMASKGRMFPLRSKANVFLTLRKMRTDRQRGVWKYSLIDLIT